MRGLKGKNVLVTGGTSGIGQAIAVRFSQYGANIDINYLRQPEEAAETENQMRECVRKVKQQGVRDMPVQADVFRPDQVAAKFDSVQSCSWKITFSGRFRSEIKSLPAS